MGNELREGRLTAGLTQTELGAAVGISKSEIGRIERGESPHVAYETLALIAAMLGLDLPLRAYPNGDAIRDAGQSALAARLAAMLPATVRRRMEVPLGIPGDLRAWDIVLSGPGWSIPVEAESRLRDVQALLRKLSLKARDGGVEKMLLLVAGSRHNRHVLRLAAADFSTAFPVPGREALASLRDGQCPSGSAIIVL